MRRGIVVVVHEKMLIAAALCPILDDLTHELERRPAMMKAAADFDRRTLERTVDAPGRRAGWTIPVVRPIPDRVRGENGVGPLDDLTVERRCGDFGGRVDGETNRGV